MKKFKDGLLIILEGADGVGKTTQAKSLVDYYNSQGYSAKYFKDPGDNYLAEKIRNLVLSNETDQIAKILLMNGSRRVNIQSNILPALRDGNIVILDKFVLSTVVYQGILNNEDLVFINSCISNTLKELRKDVGFVTEVTLLCDPEKVIDRITTDEHKIDDYRKVNDAYRTTFDQRTDISCKDDKMFIVEKVPMTQGNDYIEVVKHIYGSYQDDIMLIDTTNMSKEDVCQAITSHIDEDILDDMIKDNIVYEE